MAYEVERLRARHLEMIDLHLRGVNAVDIAQAMGVSNVNVNAILASPLAQEEISRRRAGLTDVANQAAVSAIAHATARLEGLAGKALDVHEEIVTGVRPDGLPVEHKPELRLRAADSILDRVLGKNTGTPGTAVTINAEQLVILRTALTESRSMRQQAGLPAVASSPLGSEPVPTSQTPPPASAA